MEIYSFQNFDHFSNHSYICSAYSVMHVAKVVKGFPTKIWFCTILHEVLGSNPGVKDDFVMKFIWKSPQAVQNL